MFNTIGLDACGLVQPTFGSGRCSNYLDFIGFPIILHKSSHVLINPHNQLIKLPFWLRLPEVACVLVQGQDIGFDPASMSCTSVFSKATGLLYIYIYGCVCVCDMLLPPWHQQIHINKLFNMYMQYMYIYICVCVWACVCVQIYNYMYLYIYIYYVFVCVFICIYKNI